MAAGGSVRAVFIALWVAFIAVIFMYWYTVTLAGELVLEIDELNRRTAETNATIDELQNELRGTFGGCTTLVRAVCFIPCLYVSVFSNAHDIQFCLSADIYNSVNSDEVMTVSAVERFESSSQTTGVTSSIQHVQH